jgi:hypothetical protein
MVGSSAFATVTVIPTLVPVAIPAAAVSGSGGQLTNYQTFDLKVSISAGDFWAGADIRAQAKGTAQWFAADNSGGDYTPTFRTGGTGNYYAFDTAVTAPGFNGGRATILGSSSRKTPPDSNATFPSNGSNWGTGQDDTFTWTSWVPANGMQLVDATWGDPSAATNTATGVQTIARLTISKTGADANGVLATIVGQVKATSDATAVTLFTFDIPPVPEPTSVALMGLGLGAVALRRRSR